MEQIKDGLKYSISKHFIKRENNSFLTKHSDNIALTCQFAGLDCRIDFENSPISYDIEFVFHNEFLKSFSFDLSIDSFPENQQHDICCNTQMILHDILNSKLKGAFKNIFLESKALSLLLCFQKCNSISQLDCSTCKFLTKAVEKEKIFKAKEIIMKHLNNPLTIPQIALSIGLNQCYLKKGFKEIYGMTVYDFIQEQRMLKAKLLLKENKFSVSQVAEQIGFSSISNFSSAFKKHTGVFPSELHQS